ncbi:MAG: hypothetical protein IPL33_08770 [Sphingobacteriales bacterium]|nr:hypothetical protein [Sphingobacteriales bacterium]
MEAEALLLVGLLRLATLAAATDSSIDLSGLNATFSVGSRCLASIFVGVLTLAAIGSGACVGCGLQQ